MCTAATSLVVAYDLENRSFYPTLASLDQEGLLQMVAPMLVYGVLEAISLGVVCWVLSTRLGYSAAKQLSFLLEKQWDGVQVKLIVWVLITSQSSLEHYGKVHKAQTCN